MADAPVRKRASAHAVPAAVAGKRIAGRLLDARPDRLDLRDLPYRPPLRSLPPRYPLDTDVEGFLSSYVAAGMILDQGNEGACTGFGLACVVNYLLWVDPARNPARGPIPPVSTRMLYEMAKRYDEWPGQDYDGSSCRGALKGWHKHGVCSDDLWQYRRKRMVAFIPPRPGWDTDAATRPLGVYYRIDRRSVVDMQAAIVNIGAVYVSAEVHDGWDALSHRTKPSGTPTHATLPVIRPPKDPKDTGGHAFALVGYNERGFVVQNSWGERWGIGGFAILPYDDWVEHATDAWAVAMGVPIQLPTASNATRKGVAPAWRVGMGRSLTTLDRTARTPANPPDDPWPVDHPFLNEAYQPWPTGKAYEHTLVSGNDGALCVGDFTRDRSDPGSYAKTIVHDGPLAALDGAALKLMIYAHGGLNAETESIQRIRVLAPYFEANGVYPLFLTWQTGLGETLSDMAQDAARKLFGEEALRAGGAAEVMAEARDRAVEAVAHVAGRGIWSEMRGNAERATATGMALDLLARNLATLAHGLREDGRKLELHLVGHSAGSILLGHLLSRLGQPDLLAPSVLKVRTCSLFAAACSVRFAVEHYIPADANGLLDLAQLYLYDLSDENERADGLPQPDAPAYGKSLLYLVSRALDDQRKMPLLGMQRALQVAFRDDADQWAAGELPLVQQWQATWRGKERCVAVRDVVVTRDATKIQATHGSFDNNIDVLTETIQRVSSRKSIAPMEWLDY